MRIFSQDLFCAMLESGSQRVTVTVNPFLMGQSITVPDSTVSVTLEADGETTVSGLGTQSITVNAGTDVIYSVEKETYTSRINQIITPYSNITKDVTLYNLPVETVTITTVPADAIAKITCVETGNVTNGKTAQVEVGYHYTVEVNKVGLTKTTATFICSGVAEENIHEVVMDATITWGSVAPDNAVRTMSRDSTYQNPSINDPSFKVPCNAEVVYWKVEQPGYETVTGSVRAVSPLTYIVDTTLATVVLPLATLHYTISVYPSDATVEASVYNPNSQQTRTITNVGSTVLDCYMGEQISYSVSKTNYETYTSPSPITMGSTDLSTSITLERAKNYVTISCEPSSGTISLYIDDSQTPITGTGTLTYPVPVGSTISYNASFAGADSETTTVEILNETPYYMDTIALNPESPDIEIITSTAARVLHPGRYRAILIGGGAAGQNGRKGSLAFFGSSTLYNGAQGGLGGASGYITYGDFVLEETTQILFEIGQGGDNTTNFSVGGQENGGMTYIRKVNETSTLLRASGGDSSNGGSGGGTAPGFYTSYSVSGQSPKVAEKGRKGAVGGGNAEGASGTSGMGSYNQVKGYENNAGSKGRPGYPGRAGRGVSSIQSSITKDLLLNVDSAYIQTLYNAIGGGGSGGSATEYASDYSGTSGAGGGGGGWEAGQDGYYDATISDKAQVGGKGGDGAILYMRVDWD